ncbi:hypothetical protein CEUSTIGMA_g592.t1 [Chlamydomonas eustigma]|uniref:Uncharacterized protein n=1 Tax=Chlamydomonas eustigma TaxID=1157962 RepID=A0A250WR18_9CHLO|nr:hypothetical protein CEUSTIGMA_g592.t1 [Chlamydomonas eustigma]|eukprot:GAX73139.1 hypothetical protein CEUSTIGMA_g592.t1 [Chlamydomonas eustigma]
MLRPNQLETLRELEGKVNVGKVLYCKDNLAIISGLNSDAPVGTKLSFVTGGTGVLLHHRSDNLVFALVLGGARLISVGEGVECKIKGVLQVVDETKGPMTRKDYDIFMSPAGDTLFGKMVNYFGIEQGLDTESCTSSSETGGDDDCVPSASQQRVPTGFDKVRPLINHQVDMKGREQITECLLTGVKALDILTPLGRGMSFLVIGPHGSGKTSLGLDALLGQSSTGVKCVYACTDNNDVELEHVMSLLKEHRALSNVAVISSSREASVGEKLATICAACSLGERVRDEKGHSLVVLDTVKPLSDAWNSFISGLSGLGQRAALEGLIKDEQGRDVMLPITESNEELVDYQGMLVSGAVAQRRGFFSTLFLRPAKLTGSAGGGSMTLMPLVPGRCATGISQRVDMSKYQTLSEEQKAKIQVALEKKEQEALQARIADGEISTEVVEEFISIADGQVVLMDRPNSSGSYIVNPKLSITRVGTRAYHKAMADLAPQVRLDLAQAEDARKFSIDPDDPTKKQDAYTSRVRAALLQPQSQPVALEDQIILLLAVQRGFANHVAEDQLQVFLSGAVRFVHAAAFKALQELSSTKILTAAAEKAVLDALNDYAELYREKSLN